MNVSKEFTTSIFGLKCETTMQRALQKFSEKSARGNILTREGLQIRISLSSGVRRRVYWYIGANVREEPAVHMFIKVKEEPMTYYLKKRS
jgi:hypothetical protein